LNIWINLNNIDNHLKSLTAQLFHKIVRHCKHIAFDVINIEDLKFSLWISSHTKFPIVYLIITKKNFDLSLEINHLMIYHFEYSSLYSAYSNTRW
jgi:hypothetical protein